MLLYQDNASIQIKYLDYSDSNTEKTASITLVTYGDIGDSYAYLDAPLSSGSDGSDQRSIERTKNVDFPKNM